MHRCTVNRQMQPETLNYTRKHYQDFRHGKIQPNARPRAFTER